MAWKIRISILLALVVGVFVVIFLHRTAVAQYGADKVTWEILFSKENILITILLMFIAAPIGFISFNKKDSKENKPFELMI